MERLVPVTMNRGVNFTLLETNAIWPKYKYSVETFPLIAIEDIGNSSSRHEIIEPLSKAKRNQVTGAPEGVAHAMSTVHGRNGFYFYDRRRFWNSVQSTEPSDYSPGSRAVLVLKKQESGEYDLDLAGNDLFSGKVFGSGDVAEPHIIRVANGTTPLYSGDFRGLDAESAAGYLTRELWKTDWYKNFDGATQPIPDPYTGFYKDDSWSINLAYGGTDPENLDQVGTASLRIHSTINSLYLQGWRYSGGNLDKFGAWRGGVGGPGPLIHGGYGMTGSLAAGAEARSTPQQGKMVETGWQYKSATSIGANWGVNIGSSKPYGLRFDAMGTLYTSEVISGASQEFNTLSSLPVAAFFGLGVNRDLWQSSQNGLTVLMSAWQHGRSWAWRFRGVDGDSPVYVNNDPPEGRLDRSITGVDGPWQNYGYLDANYNLIVVYQRDGDGKRNKYVKNLGKIPIDMTNPEVIGGFPDLYNNDVVFIVRGHNEDLGWFVAGVVDRDPGDGDLDNVAVVTPDQQNPDICISGKVEFGPVSAGLDLSKPNDYGFGTVVCYFRIIKDGEPISYNYFDNHYFVTIEPPKMRSGSFGTVPIPATGTKELSRGWWKYTAPAGSGAHIGDKVKFTLWSLNTGEPICSLTTIVDNGNPGKDEVPRDDPTRPPKSYYKPYRSERKIRSSDEGNGRVDRW